jgi:CopG family nickel-responsive transcriptional regulator
MPDSVARFTISIPPELLSSFDEVCAGKGYASRSEAVRDALRDYLVAHRWDSDGAGEVVGTVTLVYDPESPRIGDELQRHRLRHPNRVVSTMQVHLDPQSCLEVMVLRGAPGEVTALADALISMRGVKHGRLVCTAAG